MKFDIIRELNQLDEADDLHLARLLLILNALGGANREPIAGLTKLAKLDFLLRYPLYLERALKIRGASTKDVALQDHERHSIESSMIRYRFGPWDFRYRRFLNLLASKNLVQVSVQGRTVEIRLTQKGASIASTISQLEEFTLQAKRAKLLKHFDLTATNLMNFIYDSFPEIVSLRSGQEIKP